MRRLLFAVVLLSTTTCGGDDDAEILTCTGTCTCEDDTCTCTGGTTCEIEGRDTGVTFICDGNASCMLDCDVECHVQCPGTSGCYAEVGDDSTALCTGNGACEFVCGGDCTIQCDGSSMCVVHCAIGDTACVINGCTAQEIMDCGDGVMACRTACPPAS